ncbi:histidine kinase [Natribacillus halophilus]|uniref:Universal stress protein family protein n=1 Tax=Natribacillus halophilus TaxID=549003 RepID=A0A1G8JPA3_9BACI|nr:histidine kinase [Natribacillus halophilus]SDI33016.1 Universal stress protein family protein [Natribacillus halophilus]
MKKIEGHIDERIMVFVYYGTNSERLIQRGCRIAGMSGCPLYILTIDQKPLDELDAEKSDYIDRWKKMVNEYGIDELIIMDNETRPVAKVIGEVAREKHITQIILGQTTHKRLSELTKGSLLKSLLKEIPFIDLHLVTVARTLEDQKDHFEKGVRAYLVPEGDQYRLTFNHTEDKAYEGYFFKELGTDFNNGIFKFMKDNETMQVHVTDDYVKELKNVSITESAK